MITKLATYKTEFSVTSFALPQWYILISRLALCEGNPIEAGGFPSQRASNMENCPMSWSLYAEASHSILLPSFPSPWFSRWLLCITNDQKSMILSHRPMKQTVYELIIEISGNNFALILTLMFRYGHTFAHVMTAQLSWHVQNCVLI